MSITCHFVFKFGFVSSNFNTRDLRNKSGCLNRSGPRTTFTSESSGVGGF